MTHILAKVEKKGLSGKVLNDYSKLVFWLEDHGESVEKAGTELVEWSRRRKQISDKARKSKEQEESRQNRLKYYDERGIDTATLPLGKGYWFERHPISMNPDEAPNIAHFKLAETQWHGDRVRIDLKTDWEPSLFF